MSLSKTEALEIIAPALSHAALAAACSRTIEQYKLFGLYSDEIDGFWRRSSATSSTS